MQMLEARNLKVKYGKAEVLADITFSLSEGETLMLIGPNGAGKSTLLRTLNGTIQLTEGEVSINGKPLASYSRHEIAKRIAVVAQENETKFPITVRDFILAGRFASGTSFGWDSGSDISAAAAAIMECELEGFEDRLMNELSGGERQRVVLARAIATGARILLLDEPTANLDLAHQASMFRLVRKKCRDHRYSAVVITHDINLAAEFADRIMLLTEGSQYAIGTPAEVLLEASILEIFEMQVILDNNPVSGNVRVTSVY